MHTGDVDGSSSSSSAILWHFLQLQRLKNIFVLSCTPCRIEKKKKNTIRQSLLLSTSLLQQIGRTRVIALITLCALADVSITKDGTASAAVGLSSVLLTLTIQMTRILGLQEAFVGT